jgi:Spy/CpxP family protein refolding chaperone
MSRKFLSKKCVLGLIAAGLITVTASFAAAQDNSSNNPPSPQNTSGWHHGPPDPAQRTAELTKKLNLSSDQQSKVQDALTSEHSQMESLHQDSSLSQEDRRAKMMDIRKSTDTQIRGVLDSTQQKKWDEMQAKREQRMQGRRQGAPDGGSGGQAPPPSQQ